jgi:hypothetical protein
MAGTPEDRRRHAPAIQEIVRQGMLVHLAVAAGRKRRPTAAIIDTHPPYRASPGPSKLTLEGLVEDRWQHGVKFASGFAPPLRTEMRRELGTAAQRIPCSAISWPIRHIPAQMTFISHWS